VSRKKERGANGGNGWGNNNSIFLEFEKNKIMENQGSEPCHFFLVLVFKVPGCSPDFRPKYLFFAINDCDLYSTIVDGAGKS
jgi:hypothetical protein